MEFSSRGSVRNLVMTYAQDSLCGSRERTRYSLITTYDNYYSISHFSYQP